MTYTVSHPKPSERCGPETNRFAAEFFRFLMRITLAKPTRQTSHVTNFCFALFPENNSFRDLPSSFTAVLDHHLAENV
jgi:hypothetical protein